MVKREFYYLSNGFDPKYTMHLLTLTECNPNDDKDNDGTKATTT